MLPTSPLLNATAPAGPHLPVALLRQYAAGTLAPAAQHRVEAHTLACPRCADVLAGLLQTPPATTDQVLVQLQQRLRQRVQQAAPAQYLPTLRQRWLAPQLAAAATLLLGLVAGGWWTWQQRHAAPASPPTTLALPAAEASGAAPAPAPVGGYAALHEQLRREAAAFVPVAPAPRLAGTVRLRLTIGASGRPLVIGVVRGLRADYDAEAQRLVRTGPAWVPGGGGGQPAAQAVEVAVPF